MPVGLPQQDVGRLGFFEASEFAEGVEDLSRTVEYLQIIAAAGVDRTRREAVRGEKASAGWGSDTAAGSTRGWLTGWNQEPGDTDGRTSGSSDDGSSAGELSGALSGAAGPCLEMAPNAGEGAVTAAAVCAAADDGYRNTAEFLRARLRISAPEATRRLTLAAELLPRTGTGGHPELPVRPELAAAVASGAVASRTATIITLALDRVRHTSHPEAAATMEHALTRTAIENDADFLARIARRWTEALDQDGAEPSEELLRRIQGAFIRKPRHGLHHLEIFATADQFEHLVTVMNTATNPRTGQGTGHGHRSPAPARPRTRPRRPVQTVRSVELAGLVRPAGECSTYAPGRSGCSTAWSAGARWPSPREACPPPADSVPRSWPPSTTGICSSASAERAPTARGRDR